MIFLVVINDVIYVLDVDLLTVQFIKLFIHPFLSLLEHFKFFEKCIEIDFRKVLYFFTYSNQFPVFLVS